MTFEQALAIKQNLTAIQVRNDLERYLLRDEPPIYKGVAIAMQALEKQIPKKPQIKEFPDEDEESGDRYLWTFYTCPVCGEHIGLRYNSFCSNCGQALEWRDAE